MTDDEIKAVDFVKASGGDVRIENNVLDTLWLDRNPIHDYDLQRIASYELPQLKSIDLTETLITDLGLSYLSRLRSLEKLRLDGTPINGSGLCELTFSKLQKLSLRGCKQFSEAGLKCLRNFPALFELWLNETFVDDSSLAYVGELHQLIKLSLDKTSISDVGLTKLYKLCQLKYISSTDTCVSLEGLELLYNKLPLLNRQTYIL